MPAGRPALPLAAALSLLAALAVLTFARSRPPPARGEEAPAADFSAARALETVRALAADGTPRPVGTAANARTAEEIAARFSALGLETEIQRTFACGPYGSCAHVRNVVARRGPSGPKAVLLVAHHDSVPAGPGVADDLSGVAIVLEVARALAAGPPLPRPFVAVVTDAEETGLVGAEAFAGRHPVAREVGAVVNLEARGTSGPSLAFDTSGDPEWAVRVLRSLPRPLTTSLASAVYDLLPNDTDLTVLEGHGMPGLNLAFAFDITRYHTPLDDLAHLDPRSLQHQGENALALVRAVAREDLEAGRRATTVFFDVFGVAVVGYRRPLLVAGLAALLVVLAARRALRRAARPGQALLVGLAAAVAAPVAALGLMLLASLALRSGALPRPFVAWPAPFSGAAWAAGAGAALLAAAAAGGRAGAAGLLAGWSLLHALLGVALAAVLPGASHAFALPALAAGAATLLVDRDRRPGGSARATPATALVPGVAAAVVLFPVARLLPPMLGVSGTVAAAAVVALALLPVAPLAAALRGPGRFAPGLAAVAVAVALCGVQAALPHATEARPERVSLAFHEEEGRARWLVETEHDGLPEGLERFPGLSRERRPAFEWAPERHAFVAEAPASGLPAPRLEVLSERRDSGARRVRARLTSPRGAPAAVLVLPGDGEVLSLAAEGIEVPPPSGKVRRRLGDFRVHAFPALPAEGIELEIVLRGEAPVPLLVVDESPGLPAGGDRLLEARPRTAVPSGRGDATYVSVPAQL
jgi:hypothetical protein